MTKLFEITKCALETHRERSMRVTPLYLMIQLILKYLNPRKPFSIFLINEHEYE